MAVFLNVMVIVMLENVVVFIALILLLVAVFCIFNARGVVKGKSKNDNINKSVALVKIVGTIVTIISLVIIYLVR